MPRALNEVEGTSPVTTRTKERVHTLIMNRKNEIILRREISKQSQQRYRNRKKEKENDTQKRIDELNETIGHWREYRTAIISGVFLSSTHRASHQYQMVQMYMDLYIRGAGEKDSSISKTQSRFLEVSFSKECKLNELNFVVGPEGVHSQWVRYSMLHPQLTCVLQSLEIPTSLANVIVLGFKMTMPLRHRTIMALYPHMASNRIFLEKSMGKTLVWDVVKTFHFNEKNQIVQMSVVNNNLQAWCHLLQDMEMAVEVMTGCGLVSCLIEMEESVIEKAIDRESRHKLITVAASCRRGRPRVDANYAEEVQQMHSPTFGDLSLSPSSNSPLSLRNQAPNGEITGKNKASLSFILG